MSETIVDLMSISDKGFTQAHLKILKLAVNEYSKAYYCKPTISGLKFSHFAIVDRREIHGDKERRQGYRASGNPKYKEIRESIVDGYDLSETPPAVYYNSNNNLVYLTGVTRDSIFHQLDINYIIVGVFEIEEGTDIPSIGLYLNPRLRPSGPVAKADMAKVAGNAIADKRIELTFQDDGSLDIQKSVDTVFAYLQNAVQHYKKYTDKTFWTEAISAVSKHPRWPSVASYSETEAKEWMKMNCPHELVDGKYSVYYHLTSSDTLLEAGSTRAAEKLKSLIESDKAHPNCEVRVIVYIPMIYSNKKVGFNSDLLEGYDEGVRSYFNDHNTKINTFIGVFSDGKRKVGGQVRLYGAIPSVDGDHGDCRKILVFKPATADHKYQGYSISNE